MFTLILQAVVHAATEEGITSSSQATWDCDGDSVNNVNTSGGVGPLCGIDFGTRPVPIPQLGLTKFTPLGFHVPQAIKDKIWEGTFVDFSLLYKDNANGVMARAPDQNNLQFVMEGNQFVIKKPNILRAVQSC